MGALVGAEAGACDVISYGGQPGENQEKKVGRWCRGK